MVLESVADTSLWELNPSFNFGAQSDVPSGTLGPMAGLAKSRLLVKFDLAELPSGVVIDGATLRLSVVISPSGRANSVFEMRRVVFDWGEGNKKGAEPGGAEATAGEATWEHRLHPSTEWDDPGGDIGTDFAQDSSAEATVFDLGTYEFEFNAAGIADLVAMLADSDQNFGWAIISRSEGTAKTARRWATRENSQLSLRPQLEIQYSNLVPPPEPEIRSTELGSSSISIRILA
ncbi:MAG: DNRLRE domain-containing protein, partial [Verrucomicrobiales bacterium]|nr:DNRLRE domain-containing protein [Verrucomicrobiales bacterium]